MNISKPVKILIGFLTVFAILFPFVIMPGAMMFLVFGSGFLFHGHSFADPFEMQRTMFPFMMVLYPLILCFSLVQLGLQIFYLVHEIKNKALNDTYRILFALGTFLLPYVAMPIYFIAYLWKDDAEALQLQNA